MSPPLCSTTQPSTYPTWSWTSCSLGFPAMQDFWKPLHFRMKLAHVHVSSPASELEGHASLLQVQLEAPEPLEAELKGPSPELPPAPEPEQGPAPWPGPAPALVLPPVLELEQVSPPSAPPGPEPCQQQLQPQGQIQLEPAGPLSPGRILPPCGERTSEPDPAPEPTCPRAVTTKSLLWEEKPDFLGFPPQLIAEQFTLMDAACQGLRKFPSLHAILSALQSCTIHQLKKTWVHVSRKSSQKFKKLLIKDQSVSRKLLMEEATSLLEILEMGPWGAQVRQQQQVRVPAAAGH
nr:ral guanine nucleotide dissociation stimulator-like [Equus asinus]